MTSVKKQMELVFTQYKLDGSIECIDKIEADDLVELLTQFNVVIAMNQKRWSKGKEDDFSF